MTDAATRIDPEALADAAGLSDRMGARRRAMMEAAAKLFVTKGYASTSLSDVVKLSGGSLSTLYDLFGNKLGLFRAIVEDRCAQISTLFDDPRVETMTPREALTQHGQRLFRLLIGPEALAAMRAMVIEGEQATEMAEMFYAAGPNRGKARVAQYLERQMDKGLLRRADPLLAAFQFCELIKGDQHMRAMIGLPVDLSDGAIAKHVNDSVDTFLRTYRPDA